jgi:hypothetical protein
MGVEAQPQEWALQILALEVAVVPEPQELPVLLVVGEQVVQDCRLV